MTTELKKSSFRPRVSQGWNIETIIDFYQWAKK